MEFYPFPELAVTICPKSHSKWKRTKCCCSRCRCRHARTEPANVWRGRKILWIFANWTVKLCFSELSRPIAGKHYKLAVFTCILGCIWGLLVGCFNASHVHMPTGTQHLQPQAPVPKAAWGSGSSIHPVWICQQLWVTDALGYPPTAPRRITFLWFSFYTLEKRRVLCLFLPLFQEMKQGNGPQTLKSLLLSSCAQPSLLSCSYLPLHCPPIPHAPPFNVPSVSCRIYLAAPECHKNHNSYTKPSFHFLLITANVASSSSLAPIQLI